ncbi:MAG: hypothetical protein WC917_00395 [Bacilli bacterium]|jgi:hypothetical protein
MTYQELIELIQRTAISDGNKVEVTSYDEASPYFDNASGNPGHFKDWVHIAIHKGKVYIAQSMYRTKSRC